MKIDLLPQPTGKELEIERKKRVLNLLSIFSLSGAIVLVLLLLGYSLLLLNEKRVVERKIGEIEKEVARLAEQESLFRGYKQKVEFLTRILAKRSSFHSSLSDLWAIRPEEVGFSEITLTEKEIIVSGTSPTRNGVTNFVNRVGQVRNLGEKTVKGIVLNAVTLDKTGVYRFSVKISVK